MFVVARFRTVLPAANPIAYNRFHLQRLRNFRNFRQTTISGSATKKDKDTQPKWISFRAIFTRWLPLGSVMYIGWTYIRGTKKVSKIEMKCYEMLPFRVTSRLWGKIAACEVPVSLRSFVYGTYVKMFKVNLNDAANPDLSYYKSLADFFTRPLKDGVREISNLPCVSPCDGVVLNLGPVVSNQIEQVKGVTYELEAFLGENVWSEQRTTSKTMERNSTTTIITNNDIPKLKKTGSDYYNSLLMNKNNILHQCIIYLAPGDYHRFHSPCNWEANFRRHFSGKLLSVNPWIASLIPGLFCLNERAVYIGKWKHGFFSMTAVGATNVGSIEIYKDADLKTNARRVKYINELHLKPNLTMKKGELFGQFNMGSTIVLLFEAPADFKFSLNAGDRVKVGESLMDKNS